MAHSTSQGASLLRGWQRSSRFESGLGLRLPEAYKKFWNEWKNQEPAAVHFVPKEGMFERNEKTGIVLPIQNVKIPLMHVPEEHKGIWGGEAIIKGFQKRNPYKRRVPHFWVPTLKRSVVRSEILNEFFSVTVTDRTIRLIMDHHGFDHYLLKTPACDLRSHLALKIKQRMLLDLQNGLPAWNETQQRQKEINAEYGKYLEQYTPEEIEWYGLSWDEAIKKIRLIVDAENAPVPHKIVFRQRLIEQLREAGIVEAQDMVAGAK
jgi:large subunit ribosomal protein L28